MKNLIRKNIELWKTDLVGIDIVWESSRLLIKVVRQVILLHRSLLLIF